MGRRVAGAAVLTAALLGPIVTATPAVADATLCGVGAGPDVLGSSPAPGPVLRPLPQVYPLPQVLPLPPPAGPGVLPRPAVPCTPAPGTHPGVGLGVSPGPGVGAGVGVGAVVGGRVGIEVQDGPGSSPVVPPAAGDAARPGSYVPAPRGSLPGFPGATRARPRTPVQGGGSLRRRWKLPDGTILEWDGQHGEVEKYDKRGKHRGAFDPETGEQKKDPDPTRKVEP